MVKDMTIGQYIPGHSTVHKMDPRMKIVLSLIFIVMIFVCHNFWSLLVMVGSLVIVVAVSRIPISTILKGLKPLFIILLITAVLNVLLVDSGKLWFRWHAIHIYSGGVYTAVFMLVRVICLIVASSLLTYTTSPTLITDGMERLLSPLKFMRGSIHTVAMMMTIALRYIPILVDEFDKITSAQKARGADLETGSFGQRARALIPVFVPLFVTSFRRAYELSFAMECRCYHGYEGRTRMRQMKTAPRDWLGLLYLAATTAGIIVLNQMFPKVL